MKTSSRKKPASKSARKAPASKPRKVVAKVTAKRGNVSASASVKKAPAGKTRKAPARARNKSVLTRLEETVEKGVDAIVNTGRSIKKAVLPSKTKSSSKSSSRRKNPPILLGAIGIDLPPIKAPKPRARAKKK